MLMFIRMVFRSLVKRSVMFLVATRCQATLSKEQCSGVYSACLSVRKYLYIRVYI